MPDIDDRIVCRVKHYRQAAGWSQAQLAEQVGIKRQAVYDIEAGRYLPNTAVALKLARCFGCRVEDLFADDASPESHPITLAEGSRTAGLRVASAKVRGRLIGYPLEGLFALNQEFRPADGILDSAGDSVRLLGSGQDLDRTVFLLGCDPAFSILAAHARRADSSARVICRFASSHRALDALTAGQAHIAGTHLHSRPGRDANVEVSRKKLAGTGGLVIGFSLMEEGLMVARGNPRRIRSAADLAGPGIRMVNREPGAALRVLLDDALAGQGVPGGAVVGYEQEVRTHNEGAHMVACQAADAALGLRAVAAAFNLGFVPMAEVRCDLVIPSDLIEHPTIKVLLDVMQSKHLRDEIGLLPGYSAASTGKSIASV